MHENNRRGVPNFSVDSQEQGIVPEHKERRPALRYEEAHALLIKHKVEIQATKEAIRKLFDAHNMQRFSYLLPEEKPPKVVIWGVSKQIPIINIEDDLSKQGFQFQSVSRMKKNTKEHYDMLLITTDHQRGRTYITPQTNLRSSNSTRSEKEVYSAASMLPLPKVWTQ